MIAGDVDYGAVEAPPSPFDSCRAVMNIARQDDDVCVSDRRLKRSRLEMQVGEDAEAHYLLPPTVRA
jgi:hypothetical protein